MHNALPYSYSKYADIKNDLLVCSKQSWILNGRLVALFHEVTDCEQECIALHGTTLLLLLCVVPSHSQLLYTLQLREIRRQTYKDHCRRVPSTRVYNLK